MSKRSAKCLATCFLVALLAAACGPGQVEHAFVFPEASELPEFELIDQDGNEFGRDALAGQWDVLFFGFTHCPDICPMTLQLLATARQKMLDAGQDPVPRIVLVSVDPDRDTPELLKKYTQHFGDDVIGLTGEPDQLVALTKAVGVYFQREGDDDENYNVAHGAHVIVIDPAGRYASVFSPPHSVDAFVHDMPILMTP